MVSTTRSRRFDRRRTLRSWRSWKPFVAPTVAARKRTPEKPSKVQQLGQIEGDSVEENSVEEDSPSEVVSRQPFEILEKMILNLDANTTLIDCQTVCTNAVQQTLDFQQSPTVSTQLDSLEDARDRSAHVDYHVSKGEICPCWFMNTEMERLSGAQTQVGEEWCLVE